MNPFLQAMECAKEDWELDRQGAHEMGAVHCFQALFHLADVWTEAVDAEVYATFLDTLFHHVTLQDAILPSQLDQCPPRGPYVPSPPPPPSKFSHPALTWN